MGEDDFCQKAKKRAEKSQNLSFRKEKTAFNHKKKTM